MEKEKRVWIAQALCPARHVIVAGAYEADAEDRTDPAHSIAFEEIDRELDKLRSMIPSKVMTIGCPVCEAPIDSWGIEAQRTKFKTIEEATPELDRETEKIKACLFAHRMLRSMKGKPPQNPASN